MVRFAVIGTNFITDGFMEAGMQCKDFHVQAVYSRTIERAKEYASKYGIEDYYDSLDDVAAAENIDAVYVASPNALHAPQSIQMLNAGKHVLCEKTIASNQEELKQMLDAAKQNHVIVLEAMRPVFDPGFQAIQDHLPKLGKVRRATFQYCQYSRRYDKYKIGIIENAFKPELSNGALMDIGVYCVHPMVKLFGMPDQILASGFQLSTGAEAMGTIIARYGNEMQVELLYSKITDSILPSQIQGEEGSMIIEEIPDTVTLKIRTRQDKKWEEIKIDKKENNMYYEIEEFIRLVQSGESAEEHNKYSLWELAVMDEARRQMGIVFPADSKK
ncbi:MAG: Gfo/Idh/MocA family oxidoreductase [Lachnospiraceae bacterium]|nr:Gfo/Idh/MocA family oxidoreductase [Lachnospiraceae bacterium]